MIEGYYPPVVAGVRLPSLHINKKRFRYFCTFGELPAPKLTKKGIKKKSR